MPNLSQILQAVSGQPLAVDPRFLATFSGLMRQRSTGRRFTAEEFHAELGVPMAAERGPSRSRPAGIAVIPVYGVVSNRGRSMGASAEAIGAEFQAALADDRVDGILFDVDSPGGTVTGVPELAELIRANRKVKPTMSIANGLAASAGYWIASAADEVWMAPSSSVGAIGVYMMHEDLSKAHEIAGVKVTAISAGRFKTEGADFAPLSDETREFLQARVEEAYSWFVKDVAAGRRDTQANVRAGYGEGRVLHAAAALKAKLVDRIGTFDQALEHLSQRVNTPRRGARADILRERMALDAAAAGL